MAMNPEKYNIEIIKDKSGKPKIQTLRHIQHINPLHKNTEAMEIIKRTKNLTIDIQFLQLTTEVRRKLTNAGFSWNKSSFTFRSFTAIKSRFEPMEKKTKDIYIVILNDMFKYFTLPTSFYNFIDLVKSGTKIPILYENLLEALINGLNDFDPSIQVNQSSHLLNQILANMIHEGFVLDIQNQDQSLNQSLAAFEINPQQDLPLTFDKYPLMSYPFTFWSFPFATVENTKMA